MFKKFPFFTLLIALSQFVFFGARTLAQSPNAVTEIKQFEAAPPQVTPARAAKRAECSPSRQTGFKLASLNKLPGVPRAAVLASRVQPAKGHTFGAYWQVGQGFTSTVILRNKDRQNPVTANVVLFSHDGSIRQTIPLKVGPNSVIRLPLKDIVRADMETTEWGGLMVEFPNVFASTTVGSVVVENYEKGIIFDVPMSGGFRYDTENALHAP